MIITLYISCYGFLLLTFTNSPHAQRLGGSNRQPTSNARNNDAPANPRSEFTRHAAAAKLAAAYRGRKGRLEANYERKKQDASERARYEDEQEENRPKARQLLRPKGNSYIGF